jgi:cell volume regulation protein A
MLDVTATFIVAAVILFIGFLGDLLFRKTGFPDILFLLFFGIILGPVLGFFSKADLLPVTPYLITLSLIMILFYGGTQMDLPKVLSQSGRAALLAVTYFVLVTSVVAVFAWFFLGMSWIQALMFGPMIAGTSSIVIIPLALKLGLRKETALTLSLESTITDVVNIVFFFAILSLFLSGDLSVVDAARDLAAQFGVGILMGFVVGVAWLGVLYRIRREPYTYISTLAVLIFVYAGSTLLGGSGVLSALVFGLVLGNDSHVASFVRMKINVDKLTELREMLVRFQSELTFMIRAFFFVFLGLIYDVSFESLTFGLAVGLVFVGIDLFMRYVAVGFSMWRSVMSKDRVIMTLLCGQGLAHATLSVIPLQYGVPNAEVYPSVVVTVIIITNIITSVGSFWVFRRSKKTSGK